MNFFGLDDDVNIPGRWHLGEIQALDGSIPFLIGGTRIRRRKLVAEAPYGGDALDFTVTSFGVPVVSRGLASRLRSVLKGDVQWLPLAIPGYPEMVVLNATRLVACLDEQRSEFLKWTKDDHRSDLAGQYRQVTRLVIDSELVPNETRCFRLAGWCVELIVSEDVKMLMENGGCRGATFSRVSL